MENNGIAIKRSKGQRLVMYLPQLRWSAAEKASKPRYLSSRHGPDQRSGQNVQTNHVPEEEKVKIHAESSELEVKVLQVQEDLEDVTKFVHLRTCLTGSALHAINGVTTATENFPAVAKRKEGLLTMHDKLNGHLLELKAIGTDLDTAVSGFRMALPHLVSELPQDVETRWKDQCAKLAEEPNLQIFLDSLAEQTWCAVDPRKRPRLQRQTIGAFHTSLHPICPVCQSEHRVTVCQRFLKQQRSERKAAAVRLGMCFICLRQGHTTAMHHETTRTSDNSITPPEKKTRSEPSEETTPRVLLANTRGPTRIRFQTVKAIASGENVQRLTVNCLFDSGAEQTLVTEDTVRALGLVGMAEIATVKGIGGIQRTPTLARRVRFCLSPMKANEHDLDVEPIEALTLPQICDDIQSVPTHCGNWKYLQHLRIPEEQAKYAGVSLNDNLETDPNLQADLIGILLRFRQHRIAVQADIEKMYLQVGLQTDDRDACRFLWRDCWTNAPPRRYRLTRVCFGLACSLYLALNVLKAHAELNPGGNNQTVKLALSNMNVDDLVVSCDDEAEQPYWIHFQKKMSEHGKRELGKTFGIYWGKDEDILTFQPPAKSTVRSHHTKRQMLSLAAQEITCWSDSRVALAWIKGAPAGWKPFVANRVQEIQESVSPQCWRYCPTKKNPADIPSRVKKLSDAEARWLTEVEVKEFGIKPDSAEWGGRTSEAIHSASRVQTSNHPPTQSPGDRAADQRPPRQADACWRQSNPGSHQNKILDHQSQKRDKESDPFMPDMSSTVYPPRCIGARCLSERGLCLHVHLHDDQSGTSRDPQRADNRQFPTRAPWCGGYWERLIRSIKNALRKTIRGAFLKYDELHTVLCEIEARINDQLVFMGDDIAGEAALTPAHFLIGRELSRLLSFSAGIYRRDDTSGVNHLIRRWRYQQRQTSQLWKRWKQEYVTTLTTHGRWRKTHQEPKVGDHMLVHEPSTAWIKWPIGRIIEIHPSEDGVIRSATVKTRQGTVT
ncbi:hypothetical protein T05_9324 [Trichinella murrelli]|uniref:Peptidase A2 domain-containing protein n=1 Tax=Trichinella murrelli TaxID=144512 RepID=A0A0V0TTN7_9BILA|nr:hypothetical protein T05_9324 [Trichinella murrelli]